MFIMSPYLQMVKKDGYAVVWNSLFGQPQILNNEGLELLSLFTIPKSINEIECLHIFDHARETIKSLTQVYFIIPIDFNERKFLKRILEPYRSAVEEGKNIEYLSLIMSELCNFECTYCISNSMINASYRNDNKKRIMDFKTAKRAIDIFLSTIAANGRDDPYVNFGGGEPLLNWEVLRQVLYYCHEEYGKKFRFTFRLNTNASLITEEIAMVLKKFNVTISLSLDGLEDANDLVRISKSGESSFKQIIRAISILNKINFGVNGFSTTVTEKNFGLIDERLLVFAETNKFKDMRIDLDVIHMLPIPVSRVVKKILYLKSEAELRGLHLTGFWERPAENFNYSILERSTAFCGGAMGRSMCVSPSMEVFVCGYSAKKIADLAIDKKINTSAYVDMITSRFVGQIERCIGCKIEGQCLGGCCITEEFSGLNNNAALDYNCKLYQAMTDELFKISLRNALK